MARQRPWRHRTSLHPTGSLLQDKAALRAVMRARRDAIPPGPSGALAGHLLPLCPPGTAVAGYWPLGSEIDVRGILAELHRRGHPVLLPRTPVAGGQLLFLRWWPGVPMVRERFGTMRPDSAPGEPDLMPDLMLVPLLAFDRRCHRLGYGGGFYDRAIAARPGVRTIGCAHAAQEVDAVPVLPHDMGLDAVATERGVIFRPEN